MLPTLSFQPLIFNTLNILDVDSFTVACFVLLSITRFVVDGFTVAVFVFAILASLVVLFFHVEDTILMILFISDTDNFTVTLMMLPILFISDTVIFTVVLTVFGVEDVEAPYLNAAYFPDPYFAIYRILTRLMCVAVSPDAVPTADV
jgi:hypothetical protein